MIEPNCRITTRTRIAIQARVDTIIEARKKGETDSYVVLVVEHKTPGTLVKKEWVMGLATDHMLRGNAKDISKQCRKYLKGANLNMICIYDSCALVGLLVSWDDEPLWASDMDIPAHIFFEHESSKFLSTLLALSELGIEGAGIERAQLEI